MKSRRLFLSLALATCSALSLSSFQEAPSILPSAPLQQGKAMGMWQSPKPGQLGQAVGVLGENGEPAYGIQLKIKRQPNGGVPNGSIRGRVVLPGQGPGAANPTVVAKVIGKWVNPKGGPGKFRGVLLQPGKKTGKPMVVGVIHGSFVDPPKKPGSFKGKWAIFK